MDERLLSRRRVLRAAKAHPLSPSQSGQDAWALLRRGRDGFFLDVGCGNTKALSNTWLLEKHFGWRGIAIDPFPSGDWAAERPATALIEAAVTASAAEQGGSERFIAPGHVLGGLVSAVDLDRVRAEVPPEQHGVVSVPTRTMRSILRACQAPARIDFLSLDTEGSEVEILESFPFESYTPLTIAVEHNWHEKKRDALLATLGRIGYVRECTLFHDDLYVHESVLAPATPECDSETTTRNPKRSRAESYSQREPDMEPDRVRDR